MSRTQPPVAPLAGSKDLHTLLDIFKNADQYEQLLTGLEAKRKEINDTIDLKCTIEEAQALQSDAARDKEQASRLLKGAEVDAEGIRDAAKSRAEEYERRAIEATEQIEGKLATEREELSRGRVELKNQQDSILAQRKVIDDWRAKLDNKEQKLGDLDADLERRKKLLESSLKAI